MKESIEQLKKQLQKDEITRNAVSYEAQEIILNPALPEAYKDEMVEAAVETIHRIGQTKATYTALIDAQNARREAYNAKRRESRRLKRSQMIYKAK